MELSNGGGFTFTIDSSKLKRGLRPSLRMPRNEGYLVKSQGAVGRDGVLQSIEDITRFDTSVITDIFPYPQIFVFTNMIIVCGGTKIYEVESGSLTLKYTASLPGTTWSAVDFFDYVYMSNGLEAVIRDSGSKTYSKTTDQPGCMSMCNYNGQVIIGSPDCSEYVSHLLSAMTPFSVTASITGDISITTGHLLAEDGSVLTAEDGKSLTSEAG